jgi:hypothetical protein
MRFFEGFLDRVIRSDGAVVVRIAAGDFDPHPNAAPVLVVTVVAPSDGDALYTAIIRAKDFDDGCYFAEISHEEALITTDHGAEIPLRGASVTAVACQYDEQDFERLAKRNYEWGMSQYKSLRSQSALLQRVRALLHEQHSRVSVKIQGHEPGTTAHTLYEQHLWFLSRVLSESNA